MPAIEINDEQILRCLEVAQGSGTLPIGACPLGESGVCMILGLC